MSNPMFGPHRKHWPLLLGSLLLGSPLGCQSDLAPNAGNQQATSSPAGGGTMDDDTLAEGGSTSPGEDTGGGDTGDTGEGGSKSTGSSASSRATSGGRGTAPETSGRGGTRQSETQQTTTETQQGGTSARGGAATGGRSSSRTQGGSGLTNVGGRAPATTAGGSGTGGTRSAASTSTTATTTTTPGTAAQEYVDAHNAVRAEVTAPSNYSGTWVPLPNVTWSEEVAASAQQWANHLRDELDCRLQHEGSGTGYGENLAMGTNLTPAKAVEMWASEKSLFTYTKPFSYTASAGHYTQIVWRTSVEIGCASATCDRSVVISCRYKPPGNMIGGQIF